ncbi:MAG TPA: hypothetical protein VGL02_18355 [Streptomyces sp.]
MPRNDNATREPRTDLGFIPGTWAADYLDPGSLPRPPEAWNVLAPADLVPLHKFLVQRATELAGRGNATQPARHWSAAAGTVADLRFAWAARIHDTAADETMREAAKQTVAATLAALRCEREADIGCWKVVAESWIAQLQMTAVPRRKHRRFLRWLLQTPAASPWPQDGCPDSPRKTPHVR